MEVVVFGFLLWLPRSFFIFFFSLSVAEIIHKASSVVSPPVDCAPVLTGAETRPRTSCRACQSREREGDGLNEI